MRLNHWLVTAAFLAAYGTKNPLQADDTADTINTFRKQLQELDQKVRILERKAELENETVAEKAKTTPTVSVGASGLQVRSADSNFVFGIRGYVQADGRFGVGDSAGPYPDTFLMRRIRPIDTNFEGGNQNPNTAQADQVVFGQVQFSF